MDHGVVSVSRAAPGASVLQRVIQSFGSASARRPRATCGNSRTNRADPETCGPFITNCTLLYTLQPRTFSTELAKGAFAINHLSGRAHLWGTAEWECQSPACQSFSAFAGKRRKVFGLLPSQPELAGSLMDLKQGQ